MKKPAQTEPPQIIEFPVKKLFYDINDMSKRYKGFENSKIRHWEKTIPALAPDRTRSGKREYTQEDVELFDIAFDLIEVKGYTLLAVADKLESAKKQKKIVAKTIKQLEQIKVSLGDLGALFNN